MAWVLDAFKKATDYNGRSSRKAFWVYHLAIFILYLGFVAFMFHLRKSELVAPFSFFCGIGLLALGVLVPSTALKVRRLHDTGRSGWWLALESTLYGGYLFAMIYFPQDSPIKWFSGVGALALLVFYCQKSQPGFNRYGSNPIEMKDFDENGENMR